MIKPPRIDSKPKKTTDQMAFNTALGGAKVGFSKAAYQVEILGVVKSEPMPPAP